MRMQPVQPSDLEALLCFVLLIMLPGLFVEMKHYSVARWLNHSEHAANHGAACQQIAHRKSNAKV